MVEAQTTLALGNASKSEMTAIRARLGYTTLGSSNGSHLTSFLSLYPTCPPGPLFIPGCLVSLQHSVRWMVTSRTTTASIINL